MFTSPFPFFPHLSDSHIFLSSLSLPSTHPFLKISTDPFPSEVQCPFSALPFFISTVLGSLDCLSHTQAGSWWWNVLLLKAKYSCSERSAALATSRFVRLQGDGTSVPRANELNWTVKVELCRICARVQIWTVSLNADNGGKKCGCFVYGALFYLLLLLLVLRVWKVMIMSLL